jgi:cytochrome c553
MKKIALLIVGYGLLFAQVTLCYKERWQNLSNIETIALDGGECKGKYSVKDMQQKGWTIKDIQISKSQNGFNYNYVFEKHRLKQQVTNNDLKNTILKIRQQEKQKEKKLLKMKDIQQGKKIYTTKCSSCHGEKGEKKAYGVSRRLKDMSLKEMQMAIRDYSLKEKDNGMAIIMEPYLIISNDIKKVYKYLQEVNK